MWFPSVLIHERLIVNCLECNISSFYHTKWIWIVPTWESNLWLQKVQYSGKLELKPLFRSFSIYKILPLTFKTYPQILAFCKWALTISLFLLLLYSCLWIQECSNFYLYLKCKHKGTCSDSLNNGYQNALFIPFQQG